MRKAKETKGITLIALVITIIVLLILAGVAISMLSGENGILTRASEAKERTEEAQKEEETNLASMELETYFITNNLKYKCAYGYVTGIYSGEKVSQLQEALQAGGYIVTERYDETKEKDVEITEEEKSTFNVATGMKIIKDGQEVARTVVFGDVNCDGKITISDLSRILDTWEEIKEREKFVVVAMDVNHDGYIGNIDANIISECTASLDSINNYQDYYTINASSLIKKEPMKIIEDYIENLQYDEKNYKWTIDYGIMYLDGATSETTGNELINALGLNEKAYVYRENRRNSEEITIQTVQNGDEIRLIEPYYSFGNKISTLAIIYIE